MTPQPVPPSSGQLALPGLPDLADEPIVSFTGRHAFLSNFSPAHIVFDGLSFPTVEHAFVAAKTLDRTERARISNIGSPRDAKRAGRKLRLRADWEQIKVEIMAGLVTQKFQIPHLADSLAATGTAPLIEGNRWHDTFWGVCTGCYRGCDYVGANHLGQILMAVRARNT